MSIFSILLTILGLVLFEIISSIDNAVINAEVLSTMSQKAKRWFLTWGLFTAVFLLRGLLPWVIVFATSPDLGLMGSLTATFSNDPHIKETIEASAPILLSGGGIFLIFLFFHWLFLEPKEFGIKGERLFMKLGVWFYAVISIILATVVWYGMKINPLIGFSAVIGSTAFFIVNGFKENAKKQEEQLLNKKSNLSDISKILYLEIIDATFSIDGVLGAFAFTMSVPLILIGNGIGAFVLRELTINNIDRIKKYIFLKNGAMYSILILGMIMVADSFGAEIPQWLSPAVTFTVIGFFFWKSKIALKA